MNLLRLPVFVSLCTALAIPACILTPEDDDDGAMGSTSDPTGAPSSSSTGASSTDAESSTGMGEESTGDSGSSGSEASTGSTGEPTDTPPELVITEPMMDLLGDDGPVYDDHDDALMLWYVDVDLAAMATDAEDGDIATSVEWTTDQSAIQDAALGTGASLTVRLYSDECFGTLHTLTATVTDSDGNEATVQRQLNIWTLC